MKPILVPLAKKNELGMPGEAPVRGRMASILQEGYVQALGSLVNPARPHGAPRLWQEARHTNTQKQLWTAD